MITLRLPSREYQKVKSTLDTLRRKTGKNFDDVSLATALDHDSFHIWISQETGISPNILAAFGEDSACMLELEPK